MQDWIRNDGARAAVLAALQLSPHLAVGGEGCFMVVSRGGMVPCEVCGGSRTLTLADGRAIPCSRCESDGRHWRGWWGTSGPHAVRAVEIVIGTDGVDFLRLKLHIPDSPWLGQSIKHGDLFATLEEADAEANRRNVIAGAK